MYEKRPVALLSENTARELWREPRLALGKRIRESTKTMWREVIGVVADERTDGVHKPAPTTVYWPMLMDEFAGNKLFVQRSAALVVRSPRTGSSALINDISKALWAVNASLPLSAVHTQQELYRRSMARTTFTLIMLALAGAMALLLGLVGIYGVISYSVSQRTREIGIRMALGAPVQEVTRLFVGQGLRLAAIGVACGLAAAIAATRLMSSLLFEVSPVDPVTYAAVSLALAAAAALASYLPAQRAGSVDPMEALRAD